MANTTHSITTYVSDMLAVERHVTNAFETQRDDHDFHEYQDVNDVVTRLAALGTRHLDALSALLESLGGHEAAPLKTAVAGIEGAVAGLIDKVRKTKVSKALRDDYTALAFAIVSYCELLATAQATRSPEVSALAERHLADYASVVMEIGECIPAVVVRELADLDLDVDTSTVTQTRETIRQAWRSRTPAGESSTAIRGDIGTESQVLRTGPPG
jgi:ferritin-like metal-binding protein YciE